MFTYERRVETPTTVLPFLSYMAFALALKHLVEGQNGKTANVVQCKVYHHGLV